MTEFYLSGTQNHLNEERAKDIAANKAPAVARPYNDGTGWYVAFLVSGPLQPGQAPFLLTDAERARLA